MEVKPGKDGGSEIFFGSLERLVVGAAYLEKIARAARDGDLVISPDTTELRQRDVRFARLRLNANAISRPEPIDAGALHDLAATVSKFAEVTEGAIRDIVDGSGVPPYDNDDIATRLHLGLNAGVLATELAMECEVMAVAIPDAPPIQ